MKGWRAMVVAGQRRRRAWGSLKAVGEQAWTANSCGDTSELGCADACVGQQLGGPRCRALSKPRTILRAFFAA